MTPSTKNNLWLALLCLLVLGLYESFTPPFKRMEQVAFERWVDSTNIRLNTAGEPPLATVPPQILIQLDAPNSTLPIHYEIRYPSSAISAPYVAHLLSLIARAELIGAKRRKQKKPEITLLIQDNEEIFQAELSPKDFKRNMPAAVFLRLLRHYSEG